MTEYDDDFVDAIFRGERWAVKDLQADGLRMRGGREINAKAVASLPSLGKLTKKPTTKKTKTKKQATAKTVAKSDRVLRSTQGKRHSSL